MLKVFWRRRAKARHTKLTWQETKMQHNIQKYQRQKKGPEWDVCQRKAKGTTKKSQYQSKVIIVIPPKFESNVHVSHAKAHATAAY